MHITPTSTYIKHSGNIYTDANAWVVFLEKFFKEQGTGFYNDSEALIRDHIEPLTEMVNQTIQDNYINSSFLERIITTGNTTTIPKSQPGDKEKFEANRPSALNQQDVADFCNRCVALCWVFVKAQQLADEYPTQIEKVWTENLPADTDHYQLAHFLCRVPHFKNRYAVYQYAVKLNVDERESFFKEYFGFLFDYAKTGARAFSRSTFEPLIKELMPWLALADFDALLRHTIRGSYGDSIFETWWAFIRMHIAEILITDYNMFVSDGFYDDMVEANIIELEGYRDMYWPSCPDFVKMLDFTEKLVFTFGYGTEHTDILKECIDTKIEDFIKHEAKKNKQS